MKRHGRRLSDYGITKFAYVFLGIMCFVYLFPMYMAVVVSISSRESIAKYGYQLFPESFSLEAYELLFKYYGESLGRTLVLTVGVGVLQPIFSIFLTMCMAYPLSQADFKGRDFWRVFLLITMLFHGGLVPTYILYTKYLGLRNSIWIYLKPSVDAWNVFLFRTFFVSIDKSMVESAKIDGANKMQVLMKIMLPLTKPLVAMNFFSGFLGKWNDINTPLYYITDRKMYTIQYLLQMMLNSASETKRLIEEGLVAANTTIEVPIEATRFAMAVIGAIPVFVLFPYLQKYYAKGITIGSTKG